jgi:hypothetical protein
MLANSSPINSVSLVNQLDTKSKKAQLEKLQERDSCLDPINTCESTCSKALKSDNQDVIIIIYLNQGPVHRVW